MFPYFDIESDQVWTLLPSFSGQYRHFLRYFFVFYTLQLYINAHTCNVSEENMQKRMFNDHFINVKKS
jgi:hypothetical protein